MWKKKASWLLSVVLVAVLALSFSLHAEAGSRVYGAPQTYTVNVKGSKTGIINGTYSPIFNVFVEDEWTEAGNLFTDTYFDFYAYAGGALFNPGTDYDGYLIDVQTSGNRFSSSNINSFTIALGSNSSVANDVSLPVVNKPYWKGRTFVDYDCGTYGYDSVYLWYLGRGTHRSFSSVSGGNTLTGSFDVDITMQITVYPYVNSQASSADINNQTNSINSNIQYTQSVINKATQDQTNSINNNLNQATQNQTNTLTGGYDNSGMESTNRQLASSLASYDQAEANITDQSVDYIDAVTFFDPSTHLQLMTAVTFVSTFLQNLFVAIGDWSVLVMISLSIAFALMLVGWYKYRR